MVHWLRVFLESKWYKFINLSEAFERHVPVLAKDIYNNITKKRELQY